MNILTLIVCAYLVFSAIRGLMKGCIGTLMSTLFIAAVIIATMLLTPFVSKVVGGSAYVREFYTRAAEDFLSGYTTSSGSVDLSSLNVGGQSLARSPFRAAAAVLGSLLAASGTPGLTTEKLVGFLIGLTATAVTFVLVFIGFLIIKIIIGRSVRRSVIGGLDRALGLPLGLAKGLIVVWAVLAVINLLAFFPAVRPVALQITESPILSWLNEHNLIVKGMTGIISKMLG